MKTFLQLLFSAVVGLLPTLAYAHGEDKLGPNGGFIRMPGPFHTELVLVEKNKLNVYLLNMEWKNPSVKKSSLLIKYNDKIEAQCKIQRNFYSCTFPNSVDLTRKGELKVTAEREQQNGMEVSYPLPFKLEGVKDEHSGHH